MRKFFCIVLVLFALTIQSVFPDDSDSEGEQIVTAAEYVFRAMKMRSHAEIWTGLTEKTKEDIVVSVRKDALKDGIDYSLDQVRRDFSIGGLISKTYWKSFLIVFNPDMALEESKWDLRKVGNRTAEIHLLHKNSENPAILMMFKENGEWKVGWEETFGVRRWFTKKVGS